MEEVNDVVIFFGRFHPLVVHMPIGFLILSSIMHFLSLRPKFYGLHSAVDFSLWLGGISAVGACIVGYMLSLSGDYEGEGVLWHMWSGIVLAVIPFIALILRKVKATRVMQLGTFSFLVLVLMVTGHLGGNLTHGTTYLTQYAPDPIRKMAGLSPKPAKKSNQQKNIDSLLVYEDVVYPILEKNCFGCHNPDKRRGDLLMTDYQALLQGGKSGPPVKPGNAAHSELIKRVTLPHDDEDFMPPDGKTPLNEKEIRFIKWWIDEGARDRVLISQIDSSATIRNEVEHYLGIGQYASILNKPTKPVGPELLQKITESGFDVNEIAEGVHYLDIKVTNGKKITNENLKVLTAASKHIVWLDLNDSGITNEGLREISKLQNLIRLRVDRNELTDEGIAFLTALKNLEYLNLSYTGITRKSLKRLNELPRLEHIYYWKALVSQ